MSRIWLQSDVKGQAEGCAGDNVKVSLMWAQDRYTAGVDASGNRTSTPNAGYAGNLMAELSGTPDSQTINEISGSSSNIVVHEPPPPQRPGPP